MLHLQNRGKLAGYIPMSIMFHKVAFNISNSVKRSGSATSVKQVVTLGDHELLLRAAALIQTEKSVSLVSEDLLSSTVKFVHSTQFCL
jgi:hypothetical protein